MSIDYILCSVLEELCNVGFCNAAICKLTPAEKDKTRQSNEKYVAAEEVEVVNNAS